MQAPAPSEALPAPAHILEGAKKQLAETLAKRDETAKLLAALG
ncbi:MAG: hypothetical protein ACI4QA_01940 [Candidatus Spyradosoma sp.]